MILLALFAAGLVCRAGAQGLVVETVEAGSAAEKAGIQAGDHLLTYNSKPLRSLATLKALIDNTFGKQKISLVLQRGSQRRAVTITAEKWGVTVHLDLPTETLKLIQEGETAARANQIEQAFSKGTQAAQAALNAGDKAGAGWIRATIGDAYSRQNQWQKARDAYESAWMLIKTEGDAATQISVLLSLGGVCSSLKDPAAAISYFELAQTTAEKTDYPLWNAQCLSNLGNIANERGDLKAAQDYHERALAICEILEPGSLEVAASLGNLGNVAGHRGDLKAAQGYDERALAIQEKQAPGSLEVATSLNNLGAVAEVHRDLKAAQGYYERALAIQEKLAPGSLEVANILNNLGNVTVKRGDLKVAQDYIERSLALYEKLSPGSLDVAASLNNLGAVALKRGDLKAALDYHERALVLKEKLAPGSLDMAYSLKNLGEVAYSRGNLKAAQDYFERTLALREKQAPGSLDVADSFNDLGVIAEERGDLRAAQDYFERALTIEEKLAPGSLEVATSLGNLGVIAAERGDLQVALDYHQQALVLKEKLAPGSLDVANSLGSLGNVARDRGDLKTAQDYYDRALAIKEKQAPGSLEVAYSLNDLGTLAYDRGDLQAAQDYDQRVLAMVEKQAPDSLDMSGSLSNLGLVAWKYGDLQAAQDYFERSLEIEEKQAPGSLEVAASLGNLGIVAHDRGDLKAAQDYDQQALAIEEKLAPGSLNVASILNNLGVVAKDRGDLRAAQDYFERALAIPEKRAPGSQVMAMSLNNLGHLLLRQQHPTEALPLFTRAVALVESQRAQVNSSVGRTLFASQHTDEYAGLLQCQLALKDYPAAFATLERSRARSLVELLTERHLDFRKDAPADLLQQQDDLSAQKAAAYTHLAKRDPDKDAEQIRALRVEIDHLQVQERELEATIRQASPKLAALQYPQPLDLKAAQSTLDPGTLLLTYFVDYEATYLFVVTGKPNPSLTFYRISITASELQKRVEQFRTALTRRATFATASKHLYDLLVRPAQAQILAAQRIALCPDGPLNTLPFAALVTHMPGTEVTPPGARGTRLVKAYAEANAVLLSKLRYFSDLKPLHQLVSLTAFAQTRQEIATRPVVPISERRLLAFGDPDYSRYQRNGTRGPSTGSSQDSSRGPATTTAAPPDGTHPSLPPHRQNLPSHKTTSHQTTAPTDRLGASHLRDLDLDRLEHTAEEVDALVKLYQPHAQAYLQNQATEAAAKHDTQNAWLLHFACHGLLDNTDPLASGLALTPGGGEDGLLQAWEIFEQVRLNADLVVLSACETGLGTSLKNEGVIGLTRALQYAGAHTLAASLWSIEDESTSVLMAGFYGGMQAGKSKDVALQGAMQALRQKPAYRHPYYWAPFVLVGDWR